MTKPRLIAVDLFSGCGGLTYGLRQAGFHIAAGVENNPVGAKTYKYNNRKTNLIEKDIREVKGTDLLGILPDGKVDLLVGCAPCQGFCSITRKYKREDPRNELLLEMARIICELRPNAIMMENVPGLVTRGKAIFERFINKIRRHGYCPRWEIVQMADYGVPQSRRRLVILAGRGFVIPFPEATHARKPKEGSGLKPWVTLREAIKGMPAPITLREFKKSKGPQEYNWHVVRNLEPKTKAKLKAAMPGKTWLCLSEELRPKCHRGDYKGFPNVYGRMSWDNTAVTMTRGCTTPSMGRFGHPDRRRYTISVREAAKIQTFPDSYKFATNYIDVVCDMIGNAVPPHFAHIMGKKIRKTMESHYDSLAWKAS